jgi:hypothetical protein
MMFKKILSFIKINISAILLIIIGSFSWSLVMIKSGLCWNAGCTGGIGYWGANGHDGIWHLSLIESLSKGDWNMPLFAGETLKNYHVGFDFLAATIYRFTHIPSSILYFQIIPPILALLCGFSCYIFVYEWKKSKLESLMAVFFLYFGGSFGYIVSYFRFGNINAESLFWSQQSISTLINPPLALSLILIFFGLYHLIKGINIQDDKSLSYYHFTLATFLLGVTISIKVYGGILILFGLAVAGVLKAIFSVRKNTIFSFGDVRVFKVFVGALVVSILVFSPTELKANNIFSIQPFWFLHEMMSSSARLNWPKFASAMANYRLAGNYPKEILFYMVAFLIFLIGNLGTRVLSFCYFLKKKFAFKNYDYVDYVLGTSILAGIVAPMFFVQSGTPWNTIQFFYYSLVFLGVLSGIWFGDFLEKTKMHLVFKESLVVLAILLTVPTTFGTLVYNYLPGRPPAKLSLAEVQALNYLRNLPDGVIISQPFNKNEADKAVNYPPRSLYLYESASYISAMTGKNVYLEDEVNLNITGYDWTGRKLKLESFFDNPNLNFLLENKIRYIYTLKGKQPFIFENNFLKQVYDNSEVRIYEVAK